LEVEIPFEIPSIQPFLKIIFLGINELLKDENLKIDSVKHTNYLEHYTFLQNEEKVIFKIHYNNRNRVTKVEKPYGPSPFVESIYSILVRLENKSIVLSEDESTKEEVEKQFQFDKSHLKEFYESILSKTQKSKILIDSVEHKPYHEIYEFKKNGFTATYKFHYDGKGIFKKTELINNRTTGLGLVDEINSLLNN